VLGVELGYARVSTAQQDLDRQIDSPTGPGCEFCSTTPGPVT